MGAAAILLMAALGAASEPACLRVLAAVDAASVPREEAFERVACPDGKLDSPYRHDAASGIARLARAIAPGEVVRAFPEFGLRMVRPGDTLELVSAAGAVRIARDVEALQAARPGQRLFVKARDGQVLSVRYEDVAP